MTPATKTWHQPAPTRGALARLRPGDPGIWAERLDFDRERARRHQSDDLASITDLVLERARAAGAEAVVLSGSTARGHRTRVSDLDYHVIGVSSLGVADLPQEIDLYADEVDRFWRKLREGDDFAHWSVWYGCVLFDTGAMREAAAFVADQNAWPNPERKLRQAQRALDFAERILGSGDYGAALEQTRGALSLVARSVLLSSDVFPLARDEMPGQLTGLGLARLARDLRRSIWERPRVEELSTAITNAQAVACGEFSASTGSAPERTSIGGLISVASPPRSRCSCGSSTSFQAEKSRARLFPAAAR